MLDRGALAGYRMQDVAVEVYFGKYHDVDSSEAAFKTAGRMAFKKAFLEARPVLLEPIVNLEVTIPSKYTGAILSDLNTKRARIENQDSLPGDLAVIMGKAPLAEVTRYAAQLGSITQGPGVVHDGIQPLRHGAGQRAAADRQQVEAARGGGGRLVQFADRSWTWPGPTPAGGCFAPRCALASLTHWAKVGGLSRSSPWQQSPIGMGCIGCCVRSLAWE